MRRGESGSNSDFEEDDEYKFDFSSSPSSAFDLLDRCRAFCETDTSIENQKNARIGSIIINDSSDYRAPP
ncbi:hypothetical protein N7488_004105 [Penicillium malachiteum]|nr:hypothetical protein N7488_004105 [Penicillium malachiteum]